MSHIMNTYARLPVAFERPNRLALDVFQAKVRSDGKEFKASITDPESNNIDGQFVLLFWTVCQSIW